MERNLARINPQIFEAIWNKAKETQPEITRRAIYDRINVVKNEYGNAISPRMAANVLASRMGIDVYKIIKDKEELSDVRNELRRIRNIPSQILLQNVLRKTVRKVVSKKKLGKKIFIAHGRDFGPVEELKTILGKFGLEPVVLAEQPSGSRTVIEKLEKCSKNVSYAFIILTPEDGSFNLAELQNLLESGKEILTIKEKEDFFINLLGKIGGKVARQNVILEFGYFIGKLGRDRVCCLYKGDIQLPSDMHGIVYVRFGKSIKEIKSKIEKELKAVGYELPKKNRKK